MTANTRRMTKLDLNRFLWSLVFVASLAAVGAWAWHIVSTSGGGGARSANAGTAFAGGSTGASTGALASDSQAQRKPTYEEAQQLSEAIREVVARTGRWHKMTMAERLQEIGDAEGLVDKAGRMFGTAPAGPFGDCWAAAVFAKFYVINLNELALLRDRPQREILSADLFAPPFNAFSFGQHYNACEGIVESLGRAASKRKN